MNIHYKHRKVRYEWYIEKLMLVLDSFCSLLSFTVYYLTIENKLQFVIGWERDDYVFGCYFIESVSCNDYIKNGRLSTNDVNPIILMLDVCNETWISIISFARLHFLIPFHSSKQLTQHNCTNNTEFGFYWTNEIKWNEQ